MQAANHSLVTPHSKHWRDLFAPNEQHTDAYLQTSTQHPRMSLDTTSPTQTSSLFGLSTFAESVSRYARFPPENVKKVTHVFKRRLVAPFPPPNDGSVYKIQTADIGRMTRKTERERVRESNTATRVCHWRQSSASVTGEGVTGVELLSRREHFFGPDVVTPIRMSWGTCCELLRPSTGAERHRRRQTQ